MSHRWARAAMMVAATIVATATLGACSPDAAAPGAKIYSRSIIEGSESTVELPTGSLDLVVTKPRDELSDQEAEPRSAPDGGAFVGLSWDLRRLEPTKGTTYAVHRDPQAAKVTLVSDGRRYPIGEPFDSAHQVGDDTRSSSWWVAVDGRGEDLAVEVAYDGETQTVDVATGEVDRGRAAPLYDPPRFTAVETPCAPVMPSGGLPRPEYGSFTCRVEVLGVVPYVDGVGWAEPGRTWAIVSVSSTLFGPLAWRDEGGRVEYEDISPGVWSVDVDGRAASRIVDNAKGDNGRSNVVIAADIPVDGEAELVLRTTYQSVNPEPSADTDHPRTVGVSFTRKVRLAY